MSDIRAELDSLIKQASTERSHFYVAKVAVAADKEIGHLRAQLDLEREYSKRLGVAIENLHAALDELDPEE